MDLEKELANELKITKYSSECNNYIYTIGDGVNKSKYILIIREINIVKIYIKIPIELLFRYCDVVKYINIYCRYVPFMIQRDRIYELFDIIYNVLEYIPLFLFIKN